MVQNTPNSLAVPVDLASTRSIDSFAHIIGALRRIKSKQAKLSQERKDGEAVLKAALVAVGATVGTVNGVPVVSFASSTRIALDQSQLKERRPDIFEEFSDISEVWTFRLLAA
ncbi:hypothetical protein [Amycolatopsis sp. MtRt-6]|uniref:hypothetical protein n=1 Tax=Amycolatopsis sp. MtRt-6 TaxID=2792782 RepID=UPI001A8D7756|nr:hypothetical protein [Amycolatopsis sp. MtRt-6]